MIKGIAETVKYNTQRLFRVVGSEDWKEIIQSEKFPHFEFSKIIAFRVSALKWKRMCEETWRYSRLGIKIENDSDTCGYCLRFGHSSNCEKCSLFEMGEGCEKRGSIWRRVNKEKDFNKVMLLTIEMYRVVLLSQSHLREE